jgi:hypothetical protein
MICESFVAGRHRQLSYFRSDKNDGMVSQMESGMLFIQYFLVDPSASQNLFHQISTDLQKILFARRQWRHLPLFTALRS